MSVLVWFHCILYSFTYTKKKKIRFQKDPSVFLIYVWRKIFLPFLWSWPSTIQQFSPIRKPSNTVSRRRTGLLRITHVLLVRSDFETVLQIQSRRKQVTGIQPFSKINRTSVSNGVWLWTQNRAVSEKKENVSQLWLVFTINILLSPNWNYCHQITEYGRQTRHAEMPNGWKYVHQAYPMDRIMLIRHAQWK